MEAVAFSPVFMANKESVRPAAQKQTHNLAGDMDAFNELVLTHQDAVYRQALWLLGDEDAAEDAAQEAFLRAYRNLNTFNGGPFRPWVMRITTNYCLDQLRSQKKHKNIPLEMRDEDDEEMDSCTWLKDPDAYVEEIVERSELKSRIMECLQRLAPKYRVPVILVDMQNMDYQEAAATMGISLGTFRSRLFRARMQLQESLKNEPKTWVQRRVSSARVFSTAA